VIPPILKEYRMLQYINTIKIKTPEDEVYGFFLMEG
jgi:hypothetical protein